MNNIHKRPQSANLCFLIVTLFLSVLVSGGNARAQAAPVQEEIFMGAEVFPSAKAIPAIGTSLLSSESWSMYGHDSAHTSQSSVNGPNTADLAWIYPDEIVGDVVVGPDGTIYGTSYNPSILRAINPNGTLKWDWAAGFGETLATPAVAVDGTVYTASRLVGTSQLRAFNPTNGNILWSYSVAGDIRTAITIGTDGTIYFGTDFSGPGALYATNPNGTLKWKWNAPATTGFESTSIAISPYNGDLVFRCTGCGLVSVKSNGQLRWMTNDDTGNRTNSPSIGPDGTIYMGRRDYYFRAFNPDDGSIKWESDIFNWMNNHASAISADGSTIYAGDNGGIFYAFNTAGNIKWQYDTGLGGLYAGLSGTPALSGNGIVYFTSEASSGTPGGLTGKLYALRAADGTPLWTYDIGWGSSSPALGSDGTLYVSAYTGDPPNETYHLYAFRCADGTCAVPTPPGAFNKQNPANGVAGQSTSPTLNWGTSTDAASYEYCYDTTNDNACSNWISNGTSTSKALSKLSYSTRYYWQVRAVNNAGMKYANNSSTAFWSFKTQGMPVRTTFTATVDDGWVLESTEMSNVGGTLNATQTTFNVGDGAGDKQYRSVISFNTASLSDNAVITAVTFKVLRQGVAGTNPFSTHGNLMMDLKTGSFGGSNVLQLADFQAAANKSGVVIPNTPAAGWYVRNLPANTLTFVNKVGVTQFRLRFALDDNEDLAADLIRFFSGNAVAANRPKLIVQYYVP